MFFFISSVFASEIQGRGNTSVFCSGCCKLSKNQGVFSILFIVSLFLMILGLIESIFFDCILMGK